MRLARTIGTWLLLVSGLSPALAENPIQWITDVQEGVRTSRRTQRPILFYVPGSRDDRDSRLRSYMVATFRDRLVNEIVWARFVPVRLQRTNDNLQMLAKLGAPVTTGLYLAVVKPDGELVGVISPMQAANPQTLVEGLTDLFRKYRTGLFTGELGRMLEDPESQPQQIAHALRLIREFLIVEADESVARVLERDDLTDALKSDVYETLAVLSTKFSVTALLRRAEDDKLARRELRKCTPGGAEALLPGLDSDDPELAGDVYDAVVTICRVPDPKGAVFWTNASDEDKRREIERVEKRVAERAERWRTRVADIR